MSALVASDGAEGARGGFADKEPLFHLGLAPFVWLGQRVEGERVSGALWGGRVALTGLVAALLTLVGWLASGFVGRWGWLVGPWLVLVSPELDWRLVRLRPELAALGLILITLVAVAKRRAGALVILGTVFALSYTAVHAFVGLCGLVVLASWWWRRERDLRLLVAPAIGAAVGLLLHPDYPHNLEVWVLQNLEYFRAGQLLDVGSEIEPLSTGDALLGNLGWLLALLALWAARGRPAESAREAPSASQEPEIGRRRLAFALTVAAVVFSVLYLLMSRFALYAQPLVTLAVLACASVAAGPAARVVWSPRVAAGRLPLWLALVAATLAALPGTASILRTLTVRTDPGPGEVRLREREAFAAAIPAGSHVAAPWRQTPIYLLWAPSAAYLNTLDPVFMALPYPEAHDSQRAIWAGEEPDVPLAMTRTLGSSFLAFPAMSEFGQLSARLAGDPRMTRVHDGYNQLWSVVPGHSGAFWRDWQVSLPGAGTAARATGIGYPRAEAAFEPLDGYVDGRRVSLDAACLRFEHRLELAADRAWDLELAPWGATTLEVDGVRRLAIGGAPQAVLGQGTRFPLSLGTGAHEVVIETCGAGNGSPGFYLLER